ncbi:MAG: hypothetical protein RBT36_03810 [Desulfobulbus sp.]|nr:hypothetical protein [Desulfobulbus sp.]
MDTVADYQDYIVLFPKLFNAPLIHIYEGNSPTDAMRMIAGFSEKIRLSMTEMALSCTINIVTGSLSLLKDDRMLGNVTYICRRDGTWDNQKEVHITPDEEHHWGFHGGNEFKIFDADVVKI